MLYSSLVYNLLPNVFWSITAALPAGSPGTRLDVGFPEIIPDITFIARQLTSADAAGLPPGTNISHLNGYIQDARQFHLTYGLAPISVNSFEDILDHIPTTFTQLGRLRLVSHGNDRFLFLPLFNSGQWGVGMQTDYLQAVKDSDEDGLRFLVNPGAPSSPSLVNGTSQIISGMTSLNNAVVTPLGSPPSAEVQKFIELVNDFYQVINGTITVETGNPVKALITPQQQAILNASLSLIETAVRTAITNASSTVTTAQLNAFKTAVLVATPVDLEFLGNTFGLSPTVITDVNTAMAAAPRVESDLRTAISGGTGEPLFRDFLDSLVLGLTFFNPNALKLGSTTPLDVTAIRGNGDLQSFALTCVDLFFLKNGPISIGTTGITLAQKTTLRNAILAISDIVRQRVTGAPGSTITAGQLNALRTAMENLSLRQSAITGGIKPFLPWQFAELSAANHAMQNHFRDKLSHFRGLMQPADASKVDIRGCMVGKTPSFLDVLRDFLGTVSGTPLSKPTISAPEWWQSFPFPLPTITEYLHGPSVYSRIDNIVTSGPGVTDFSAVDVSSSFTLWRGMIDFDAHFNFITGLFAGSKRDFASLAWRVWQTGGMGAGIPVLRMEAKRVDDLASLNLGDMVERLRVIFEVAPGSAPNATMRGKLSSLQPLLLTYKIKSDAVAVGPAPGDLPGLFTDLTSLAGSIAAITGATPASLAPASNSLVDIQTSVTNIGTNVDTFLTTALDPFFTAVQARTGHANAAIRYYCNVGLPLPLQSSTKPLALLLFVISAGSTAESDTVLAAGLRSWMRVQWSGTAAQAATMNSLIASMAMNTSAIRNNAAQTPMLSDGDPQDAATVDGALAPTQRFHDHLVTRP